MPRERRSKYANDAKDTVGIASQVESLSSSLAESMKFQAQANFVELIKNRVAYNRLRIQKLGTYLQAVLDDGNNHSTYSFKKDPNDDFNKLGVCFVGKLGLSSPNTTDYKSNTTNRTGTWVLDYPPNYYATVVGATFSASVKGEKITFAHFSDPRGGIWEFVVDGDTANKVTISTWAAVGTYDVEDVIKTGLDPNVVHTVVATFKGDDPAHVPSTGAGTSRGWATNQTNTTTQGTMVYYPINGYIQSNKNDATLLNDDSNKEFAITIKAPGKSGYFVPEHTAPVAFNAEPPKYIVDGVEVNFATMAQSTFMTCNAYFELQQHCYVVLPNNTGNIAEFWITHHIDKNGAVSYTGKIKALQPCTFAVVYPMMIPCDPTNTNLIVTGIGNQRVPTTDEAFHYLSEEKDKTYSACGISSTKKNYIVAGTIENPVKTYRVGKDYKPPVGQDLFVWDRASTPKIYFSTALELPMQVGDGYNWAGSIAAAEIKSIYDYIAD
jgi:hypothetical protein